MTPTVTTRTLRRRPAPLPRPKLPPAHRRQASRPVAFAAIVQWSLVVAGVVMRVRQYAADRSLWTDEAMIALNVLHKGYGGLTGPLGLLQAAPTGWLWTEKTATVLFGSSELSLRLPQVVSGCLATVGIVVVARRLMGPVAVCVATGLFCLSPSLVYYSSEVKPYGFDAAVVVGLLVVATRPARHRHLDLRYGNDVWLAAASVLAVLLSFPAVFVVGVLMAARLVTARADRRRLMVLLVGGLAALVAFSVQYLHAVRPVSDAPAMRHFWASGYAPRPLAAGTALHWLGDASDRVARYPLQASVPWLLLCLVVVGAVVGVAKQRLPGSAIAGCLLLAVIAAIAGAYPLRDRMSVFAMPLVFLLVGWAVEALADRRALLVGVCLSAVTFAGTFPHDLQHLGDPYIIQQYRQAIEFAGSHARPGDTILNNYQANALEVYYRPRTGVATAATFRLSRSGCASSSSSTAELDPSGRVWLVFGNFMDIQPFPSAYLTAFSTVGRLLVWHQTSAGNGAALFQLDARLPSQIRSSAGCITFGPPPRF